MYKPIRICTIYAAASAVARKRRGLDTPGCKLYHNENQREDIAVGKGLRKTAYRIVCNAKG